MNPFLYHCSLNSSSLMWTVGPVRVVHLCRLSRFFSSIPFLEPIISFFVFFRTRAVTNNEAQLCARVHLCVPASPPVCVFYLVSVCQGCAKGRGRGFGLSRGLLPVTPRELDWWWAPAGATNWTGEAGPPGTLFGRPLHLSAAAGWAPSPLQCPQDFEQTLRTTSFKTPLPCYCHSRANLNSDIDKKMKRYLFWLTCSPLRSLALRPPSSLPLPSNRP